MSSEITTKALTLEDIPPDTKDDESSFEKSKLASESNTDYAYTRPTNYHTKFVALVLLSLVLIASMIVFTIYGYRILLLNTKILAKICAFFFISLLVLLYITLFLSIISSNKIHTKEEFEKYKNKIYTIQESLSRQIKELSDPKSYEYLLFQLNNSLYYKNIDEIMYFMLDSLNDNDVQTYKQDYKKSYEEEHRVFKGLLGNIIVKYNKLKKSFNKSHDIDLWQLVELHIYLDGFIKLSDRLYQANVDEDCIKYNLLAAPFTSLKEIGYLLSSLILIEMSNIYYKSSLTNKKLYTLLIKNMYACNVLHGQITNTTNIDNNSIKANELDYEEYESNIDELIANRLEYEKILKNHSEIFQATKACIALLSQGIHTDHAFAMCAGANNSKESLPQIDDLNEVAISNTIYGKQDLYKLKKLLIKAITISLPLLEIQKEEFSVNKI